MPVPSPLSVKVTPAGSDPDSESEAVGLPVEVTLNEPGSITPNTAAAKLEIPEGCVSLGNSGVSVDGGVAGGKEGFTDTCQAWDTGLHVPNGVVEAFHPRRW